MTATLCTRIQKDFTIFALFAVCLLDGSRAGAQRVAFVPLVELNGEPAERLRLAQLLGDTTSLGFLIRSASTLTPLPLPGAAGWLAGIIAPEYHTVHNSGLPYSLNEGPMWAGRGWNQEVTAGFFVTGDHVRLIAAPIFVSEENQIFQVIPYPQTSDTSRSVWANPFHPLPESIDLPLRMGDERRERLYPGQSTLAIDAGGASFGASTENIWWGPGIRNAILLSDNAPGFPHLFLQTHSPLHTSAGTFGAQWILGQLSESDYFDQNPNNNYRSLNGLAATWSPAADSGLSIGLARLVMGNQTNSAFPLGSALNVFRSVGHPNTDTTEATKGLDQITELFARWVFGPGFEGWAEWARFEEPLSLQDFLEYPGHSEGYTLGLQWAHRYRPGSAFQLQTEATYLEPDPSLIVRPVATTYTSRAVPQGWTNQGQTLGAAIGPGGSSQWLAFDWFQPRWRLGFYLNRIRWDNGTLFEPIVPEFKHQDVTLSAGLRGSYSWRGMRLSLDFEHAARFNYLWQSYILGPSSFGGIDLINNTFTATLSTAVGPR